MLRSKGNLIDVRCFNRTLAQSKPIVAQPNKGSVLTFRISFAPPFALCELSLRLSAGPENAHMTVGFSAKLLTAGRPTRGDPVSLRPFVSKAHDFANLVRNF